MCMRWSRAEATEEEHTVSVPGQCRAGKGGRDGSSFKDAHVDL